MPLLSDPVLLWFDFCPPGETWSLVRIWFSHSPLNSLRLSDVCIYIYIYISNLTIIVSDNGLSPGQWQAFIWTNAGTLLIGPLGTNFSEILIRIQTFSFKKMHFKISSVKWWPFCFGLNVLTHWWLSRMPHDDVMTCKSCMHYWPFVRGIHKWPVNPLTKGQ